MGAKVRVRDPGFLRRLFHANRRLIGKEGIVVCSESGKYSHAVLYTIFFELGGKERCTASFFYDELEFL